MRPVGLVWMARVTLETLLRHEGSSPLAVATVSPSSKSCERSSPSLVLVESPQGDAYTRAWSAGDRPGAMSSKSEGFESMYARTAATSSVESTDRSTPAEAKRLRVDVNRNGARARWVKATSIVGTQLNLVVPRLEAGVADCHGSSSSEAPPRSSAVAAGLATGSAKVAISSHFEGERWDSNP
jgi:hypothetical protein